MATAPRIPASALHAATSQPPMSGISLSELLDGVKRVIERSATAAVWVHAEIAKLDRRNGMAFLELAEHDAAGKVIAKCEGRIWARELSKIEQNFCQVAGEPLQKGIRVLCLGRIKLHEAHGLALHIDDIDPTYTVGELTVRMARIRERLREDQIAERNQSLPAPQEFVRLAIISPQSSAGLEDFRREADYLQECGLCQFVYFTAAFQSQDAPKSICQAIRSAYELHEADPFDAVAIIRGGGTVTDLAYLNDYVLAKWVCRLPIPVFTGIGHKRDNTILDEVCHTRFDTPSKVVLHVLQTIWKNAVEASRAMDSIRQRVAGVVAAQEGRLGESYARLQSGIASALSDAAARCETDMRVIRTSLGPRLRERAAALDATRRRIRDGADAVLFSQTQAVQQLAWVYRERSTHRLTLVEGAVEQQAREIRLQGLAQVDKADAAIVTEGKRLTREATATMQAASDEADRAWAATKHGAVTAVEHAQTAIDLEVRAVVASGPEATLRRGFALARDESGLAVTSHAGAARLDSFDLQFHDGTMRVLNPEKEYDHEPTAGQ